MILPRAPKKDSKIEHRRLKAAEVERRDGKVGRIANDGYGTLWGRLNLVVDRIASFLEWERLGRAEGKGCKRRRSAPAEFHWSERLTIPPIGNKVAVVKVKVLLDLCMLDSDVARWCTFDPGRPAHLEHLLLLLSDSEEVSDRCVTWRYLELTLLPFSCVTTAIATTTPSPSSLAACLASSNAESLLAALLALLLLLPFKFHTLASSFFLFLISAIATLR